MASSFQALLILAIASLPDLNLRGFQPPAADMIYYGVVHSESSDAITLNVAPCDKTPNLQTVSPYQKVGVQQASCPDGKPYMKTAVQAVRPPKGPDKKESDKREDSSKKQPEGGAKEKSKQ